MLVITNNPMDFESNLFTEIITYF